MPIYGCSKCKSRIFIDRDIPNLIKNWKDLTGEHCSLNPFCDGKLYEASAEYRAEEKAKEEKRLAELPKVVKIGSNIFERIKNFSWRK